MTNLSFNSQEINFWMESRKGRTILIGSDIMPDFEISLDALMDYLYNAERIGEWYCEIHNESILVTMQDFWQEEEHEINMLLDEYIKNECLQQITEQEYKETPLPVSDLYERAEGGQRPIFEEERYLKNIW